MITILFIFCIICHTHYDPFTFSKLLLNLEILKLCFEILKISRTTIFKIMNVFHVDVGY
jgi:hypothetical protein